ncbi:monovalent cation/H+ antiporter complex subunit F [Fuerstiella marisgermanici]|uniref:Sodium-cholate efflux protein MrpF n=1 Tax=Fuerstiella marisgermanici TaxID=1891926 RepID=A0A1P8WIN9_9PLAN|nr:monovalent cation/H+ antiporter complex subunit F [Fuerstiella marisgermanici]APZ93929.1 Sodium-cholate efflux protein MrpF [Fuerstiella marisgermanici]
MTNLPAATILFEPIFASTKMVALTTQIVLAVLVFSLALAFLRLVIGPSLPDRVVALDLIATLLVGLIAVSAIETGDVIFLRVAMVVALFNFIGTIGFSWYLQQERQK